MQPGKAMPIPGILHIVVLGDCYHNLLW